MDFGAAIAAGINQATTVGMGLYNNNQARKAQQRALRYDKELSKYNYDLEVEQWNRANAYNTPSAQMQRYKEAGLNPNLIYSQSNEASSSAPTAGANFSGGPGYSELEGTRFIDDYTALSQQQLNEKNTEADVNLKNSQADLNAANTASALLHNVKLEYEKPYWSENAKYDSDIKKYGAQSAKQDAYMKLFENLYLNPARLRNMQVNSDMIEDQTRKIKEEIASIQQDRTLSWYERKAKIGLLNKELGWYDKMRQLESNQMSNQIFGSWLENQFNMESYKDRLRNMRYQVDINAVDADWRKTEKWMDAIIGPVKVAGNIAGGLLVGKGIGKGLGSVKPPKLGKGSSFHPAYNPADGQMYY